jgi:hypothetical protein
MTQTVTRLFDNYSDAVAAVRALEAQGIDNDDISIVANNADGSLGGHEGLKDHGDVGRGASTGAIIGGVGGLLAGLGILAIPGLGPIVAAGWLASTAVGAGIGAAGGAATGGIVEALKNSGHSEDDANIYAEGVRRGGTLVSARVDDAQAVQAQAILDSNRAVDTQARANAYRQSGWSRFDPDAPALGREDIERERASYRSPTERV